MKNHIPIQKKGAESVAGSELTLPTIAEAESHFELVKKRFNDINSWNLFAGKEKAEFSLRNSNDELLMRPPQVGDFVKIKIHLLHNTAEDGFDWVKVEVYEREIKENFESIYLRLRPTANPTLNADEIVHFLDSSSTSNFVITRDAETITADVYARNEIPNTKDKSVAAKVRNKAVALGGMLIGSKIQWEALTSGLLEHE